MTGFVRPFSCLIDLDISNSLTFQVYAAGHHTSLRGFHGTDVAPITRSRGFELHLLRRWPGNHALVSIRFVTLTPPPQLGDRFT